MNFLNNFKSNKIEPFNDNFLKTKTVKKIKKKSSPKYKLDNDTRALKTLKEVNYTIYY